MGEEKRSSVRKGAVGAGKVAAKKSALREKLRVRTASAGVSKQAFAASMRKHSASMDSVGEPSRLKRVIIRQADGVTMMRYAAPTPVTR